MVYGNGNNILLKKAVSVVKNRYSLFLFQILRRDTPQNDTDYATQYEALHGTSGS